MSYHKPEIDYRTMKMGVGIIAIGLAYLTNITAGGNLPSISDSYHVGGLASTIFVGCLFVISAFLIAYNGKSNLEFWLSKISAVAAIGIAIFPCKCEIYPELVTGAHGISAAIMFLALVCFCIIFLRRALAKGHPEALMRAGVYTICFLVIMAAIITIAVDGMFGGFIKNKINNIVFYGERAGLIAFGLSWLTASHVLPILNSKNERHRML